MRQIEKHSRQNPPPTGTAENLLAGTKNREIKQALIKREKQQKEEKQEAQKVYEEGLERHRSLQTEETRNRMASRLKESEQKYGLKKEFFLVRWFRPRDPIEKIEKKRIKETQKRMTATRKKSEQNNITYNRRNTANVERKSKEATPKDMPHGGGGTYTESRARKRR
jgi:hypothetical protein